MTYGMHDILVYFSYKYEGDFDKIYEAIKRKERIDDELYNKVCSLNLQAVTCLDEDYPEALKHIYQSPFVLFYRGDLSLLKNTVRLAVIGSREPSDYGLKATKVLIEELLSESETVIVSGLALGIDKMAHQTALNMKKKTIAVLGNGLDNCYPTTNYDLFEEIGEKGLLISEYPPFVKADAQNFPKRNRLISAFSKAILVTDAKYKSGTRITVRHGLEQGKDIFAVPHEIFSESYCNLLIKEGAALISSGKDLIELLF